MIKRGGKGRRRDGKNRIMGETTRRTLKGVVGSRKDMHITAVAL